MFMIRVYVYIFVMTKTVLLGKNYIPEHMSTVIFMRMA